jgi:hypothetical protein
MTTTNAYELGYNQTDVMKFYEAQALSFYNSMCSAANACHTSLYSTARGLLGNKYTKPTGENLMAQARTAEVKANEQIAKHKLDYQQKVQDIIQYWNNSRIIMSNSKGDVKYFQVPYLAGINYINGVQSLNFMGNNYQLTEIDYKTALTIQPEESWQNYSNFSNGSVNINVSGNFNQVIGHSTVSDADGDVVMGNTYIGDKVIGNVFNQIFNR